MTAKTTCFLLGALALVAAPALAGPLQTAPGVYDDGLIMWHGSTSYQGYFDPPEDPPDNPPYNTMPSGLSGHVDWAVYAPGTFPGAFTVTGGSPTPGDYVYVYQAYETGAAPLSQLVVIVENEANNIGWFTGDAGFGPINGVQPDVIGGSVLVPFNSAQWTFSDGVPTGSSTTGLIFSAPGAPTWSSFFTVDDGTFAFSMPVPQPAPPVIPEPASLTLLACGLASGAVAWLRRRAKTVRKG